MLTLTVPMIFGFVATLAITFSFMLYHCITIKEEYTHKKKAAVEEELESVETSQTLRTQRERFEEQMETLGKRIHLITFRATQEEADYILSELPVSTYLYNLATDDLDNHVIEARLKRARAHSI